MLDKCISGLFTFYNPVSAHELKMKILNFNPDVIHVHNFLPLISPSIFILANKLGIPVILTLHNYRLICPSATLFFKGKIYERGIHSVFHFDAIWKGVYRNSRIQTAVVVIMTVAHNFLGTWKNKVDGYIALTNFAKDIFLDSSISIDKSKLFVKSNFVEESDQRYFVREKFFLFIGRLTEEKGIDVLLKAAKTFRFKLVIIGDGPLKRKVASAAKNNPDILYLGLQSKAVVIEYLKKCRALIFPSIWYEGFPMTILEAFSTGTPVIASNLGGMREIIQDKINGLHFVPGDELHLIAKIIQVSTDQSLASKLSNNARLSYLEHYTPARNYEQLTGIYQSVVDHAQSLIPK
jgi:glycosyltransferase involved in cell wall biosynthesis